MLLENQEELGFVRFGGWFWRIVLLTRLGNDGIVSFEARKERIGLKERTKKEIERVVIWRKGKKEGEGRRPFIPKFRKGRLGFRFRKKSQICVRWRNNRDHLFQMESTILETARLKL